MMHSTAAPKLQVIGNKPSFEVAVGDYVLQIGGVRYGRAVIADPIDQPSPLPRALPVEAKGYQDSLAIERKEQLQTIIDAVKSNTPVEVTGLPGIGKSTLLRQLARKDWLGVFPDGVVFENCNSLGLDDILQRIFDLFFDTYNSTNFVYRPTRTEVIDALRTKKALIILDQLSLAGPPLEQLCQLLPSCSMVFGSGRPLLEDFAVNVEVRGLSEPSVKALLTRIFHAADFDADDPRLSPIYKSLKGEPMRLWQAVAKYQIEKAAEDSKKGAPTARGNESRTLTNALREPRRGETTRQLLRVLAAASGEALPIEAAVDVVANGNRHRLETALNQLTFEGLVIWSEETLRLAPNMDFSASCLLPDLRDEVAMLLDWFARYYSDNLNIPVATTVPNGLFLLLQRASELELYEELTVVIRVAEVRWIRWGQWDTWKRALRLHMDAAHELDNRVEYAWALNQLALCSLCIGDRKSALTLLAGAKKVCESAKDRENITLAEANIRALEQSSINENETVYGTLKIGLAVGALALAGAGVWWLLRG